MCKFSKQKKQSSPPRGEEKATNVSQLVDFSDWNRPVPQAYAPDTNATFRVYFEANLFTSATSLTTRDYKITSTLTPCILPQSVAFVGLRSTPPQATPHFEAFCCGHTLKTCIFACLNRSRYMLPRPGLCMLTGYLKLYTPGEAIHKHLWSFCCLASTSPVLLCMSSYLFEGYEGRKTILNVYQHQCSCWTHTPPSCPEAAGQSITLGSL